MRRQAWLSKESAPDGFSVASNGYLTTGTGQRVDFLDEVGGVLVRI